MNAECTLGIFNHGSKTKIMYQRRAFSPSNDDQSQRNPNDAQ